MNVLEVMRLFGECGFEFLPETDLQRRPELEVVMTVGLHLCALEMTNQQVDTLACIALAGQLPEFFPLLQWTYAVKKSFMSQEVVTCATRAQWNEVCTMLQEVNNTELSLRSKNGTTLWTRASPCLPTPEDDAFPLQVLTPPPTRELARMPEVIQIEATGLGGKNLGVDRPWDISIRTDPEGQNVYGPSLATVEDIVIEPCESGGTSTKHVTSLGISKATHEFLTLHYFGGNRFWGSCSLMHSSLRQLFVGLLLIRCLWRLTLPRRTEGHLIQCGKIPSVSLLIYCLEMELTATWVQCNELILLWRRM